MSNKPTEPLTPEQEAEQAAEYAAWRAEVADRLNDASRWTESRLFRHCGEFHGSFYVLACETDPAHEAKALPWKCHLRYCPDCEHDHQAQLVAKYTPILKDLSEQSDNESWSLKKIELTTPYSLDEANADALFVQAWEYFERWLQLVFQSLFADEMTSEEKRHSRIDLKKRGIGVLVAVEFGEHGRKLHFHILAYMPWIKKQTITDLWREASNGECEVNWVRRIDYHGVEDAVREVLKYVTKFTQLAPALVIKLADVLDGQRRLRTYGTVRGAKNIEPEPHICSVCAGKFSVMNVREYFVVMLARNVEPDAVIAAAGSVLLLDLKRAIKSGEVGAHLARDDPDELPKQQEFPILGDILPKTKPFRYD